MATSKYTKHKKSVETSAKSGKAKIDTSGVEVKKLVIDTEEVKDKKASVTLTVSSIGDCTLGTDVNFNQDTSLNAYYNAQGADYFFQNVRSILSEDDLTIVNMEGTLTDSDQRENKTYAFKAPPEYEMCIRDRDKVEGLLIAIVVAAGVHAAMIILTKVLERPLHFNSIEKASIIYSNSGFLVIPLVASVLGQEWVFYTCLLYTSRCV